MTGQYPPYPGGPPRFPGPPIPYGPPPDSNLVWGILTTILCCLPLGIVAIVKSSQVNSLWFQGFPVEAHKAAADAKKWAMWSAIAAGSLLVVYVVFVVVMFVILGVSLSRVTP